MSAADAAYEILSLSNKNASDTDALVDIFVEIANLPETPETVATVMEAMEVTKVLDVVSAWVDAGSLEEFAEVFSYFSEDFLETIYLGMTTAERTALYPHLSEETVAALPDLGEFEVGGLSISPETVEPGEIVTISVDVENVGTGTSTYTVNLKIDGTTEESTELTLAAGEDETVTWTVSKTAAKTYNVDVNGLTGSFTLEAPQDEPGLNWILYAVAGVVILVIAYVVYKQFLES